MVSQQRSTSSRKALHGNITGVCTIHAFHGNQLDVAELLGLVIYMRSRLAAKQLQAGGVPILILSLIFDQVSHAYLANLVGDTLLF